MSALGSGREFDLIRAVWSRLGERMAGDVGDDCAFVELGGVPVAITTDIAVEGTHFKLGWLTHYEVGWRAGAGGLSDLAAVAAKPEGIMVSLGVPAEWHDQFVVDVMDGVGAAAAAAGAKVWGGDVVRSERCTIDIVCVGTGTFVKRRGAQSGDALWVTGRLGGPQVALDALYAGHEPEVSARERLAHPVPRIREAEWLAERGARAMIDVSDGLVADAGHLAAASGVEIVIDAGAVPAHPSVAPVTSPTPLISGEEYELLVAMPPEFAGGEFEERFGIPLTRIGTLGAGAGVHVTSGGAPLSVPAGYRHFS